MLFFRVVTCLLVGLLFSPFAHADNAALLAFKREQIALARETIERHPLYSSEMEQWITAARAREKAIQAALGDAAISLTGQFHERAYFARNDGSPQPFWVALPDGYTPQKKWPLVVFLHGYITSISKLTPWLPPAETVRAAQSQGLILAIPYGRRNSDFVQWGQDDVLQVRAEVIKHYSVDQTRVSLVGASMGGYGTYATGLHNPGNWAALAPICGRSDMFLWFKTAPETLPPWKRLLYSADDPRTLLPNALTTPIFAQHGALDPIVPVEHSRRIAADAKEIKTPFYYLEVPEGSHGGDFQLPAFEKAFAWVKSQTKQTPRQITIVAGELREAKNDWAQITAFQDYNQLARLDVRLEAEKIVVNTKNVGAFILNVPRGFYHQTSVALEINGAHQKTADPLNIVGWRAPDVKIGKNPERCGPFKNLMRDPFLLVYGNKRDRKDAERFAHEWKQSADGEARIKSASAIRNQEKFQFNLILFGDAKTNPLIKEIGTLPVQTTGENQGMRIVLPSPWNLNRIIGVCSGAWWGEKIPLNHKWDLLPDYIVYDGEKFEEDDTNLALEAGFFDGDWRKVKVEDSVNEKRSAVETAAPLMHDPGD